MKKTKKRVISCVMTAALLVTTIPFPAIAKTSGNLYGDANGDGKIDLLDALAIDKYLAGTTEDNFQSANADVNHDSMVDSKDSMILKKYLAEWDITLEPDILTVSFYDGDRLIDTLQAEKDSPLQEVPSVAKSSKENAVLLGYYTDKECTIPFYADNPVTENMNVYAKYQELEGTEELNLTSFAQMDIASDAAFDIVQISEGTEPENAAVLEVKDGSAPVTISIIDEDGDGIYTVKAPDGFREGCSYELTLADGWAFHEKEETIRKVSFSIEMDEVENLRMNDDIIYIKDTDDIDYKVDGKTYPELTSEYLTEDGGTFEYDESSELEEGDILCIYVGTNPTERDSADTAGLLDPAVYVKVTDIEDDTVSFVPLDSEDQDKMYDIPDNFPIHVDAFPEEEEGTVNISNLDRTMYADMMGAEDGTYENALQKINAGDFITLYTSSEEISSEENLYFAEVKDYKEDTGEITYEQVSKQDILDSMNLYTGVDISGSDIITEEQRVELEDTLQQQVEESRFADEAAALLSNMLTEEYLGQDEAKALNISGTFEPSDDIKVRTELITNGEQLHFGSGIQLAVHVDATFEAETEDGKAAIDLSATFVQEVEIHPSVHGSIVTKEVVFIPIPIGVEVSASVDIKNYTAFNLEADLYTIESEDEDLWEKIKSICSDPTEITGLAGLPESLKSGLHTVSDVMAKIEELQDKIDKASDTAEQIEGYKEDVEDLWQVIEETGLTTEEDWKEMGQVLGKTNVASDLLELIDMTDLSGETEISEEYRQSLEELIDKYKETIQKETDWIKIVEKEICSTEVYFYGLVIGVEADFIVRTDMSIAIGSNMEYEVGKRYTFWFKIGLFQPSAGNSSMDLIDEQFAFQFYVMGRLGIKAGVQTKLYVGLGSGKFASVGITAELGPYVKLYGFFVYENDRYRPANSQAWTTKERMEGALYVEFGLYFILGFEANALGNLFEYSYDFMNEEIPILKAGQSRYYYENAYEPEEDEKVILRDDDEDSTNGIAATLPDKLRVLRYIDLNTGIKGQKALDYSKYQMTLSNPAFSLDKETGVVSVDVPEGVRYMECDLTITYLYGKLAFSNYDMSVTIPLVWTNLSTDELNEYYTVSVRAGNDADGYQTIWSKKVLKNEPYDLPSDEEVKDMLGWNDAKYVEEEGYGDISTTGLSLIEDKVYDYKVGYQEYSVTVNDIQNEDGTTRSETYTAKYGETFDFSALEDTGTAQADCYTRFAEVTTDAQITVNGQVQDMNLGQQINAAMAQALSEGVTAEAVYVNDGVNVTYHFTGLDHKDITQLVKKRTVPDFSEAEGIVSDNGLAIKEISPELSRVTGPVVYQVVCGNIIGPDATIKFHANGGSSVSDITKVEGSLIGTLPVPVREGYTFEGWYTDKDSLQNEFTERKMPVGGAEVYAKWIPKNYTITFHVNGGNELAQDEQTKTVTYDQTYGTLPTAEKNGYAFTGWYTAAENGTHITEASQVTMTKDHTLYAHWLELKQISKEVFDFGELENPTYEKGVTHQAEYTFDAGEENIAENEFTIKYMRQGNADYEEGLPVNAGVYNVTISRPADNVYAKFEQTYEAVLKINKAVRTVEANGEVVNSGYTYLTVTSGNIDDLSAKAVLQYTVDDKGTGEAACTNSTKADRIDYLTPEEEYQVYVSVTNDPNYEDVLQALYIESASTMAYPEESWSSHADTSWYNDTDTVFTITTPEQLAGVAVLSSNFSGKTVLLGADMDMTGYEWTPICDFAGTFNGQNHTVSGMVCANNNYSSKGLIGYTRSNAGAYICNVRVEDSCFVGKTNVGGIVGKLQNADMSNCVSAALIANGEYTGGIAGNTVWANISRSISYGRIIAKRTGYCGGVVGYLDSSKAINCANFATVYSRSRNPFVGGISGFSYHNDIIYNCYNVGTIAMEDDGYYGAILGCANEYKKNEGATFDQCYYLNGSAGTHGACGATIGKTAIKSRKTAWFTSPDSTMSNICEDGTEGMNLVDTLNTWSLRVDKAVVWEVKEGESYPTIIGMPESSR